MNEPKHRILRTESAKITVTPGDVKMTHLRPLPEEHNAYPLIGRVASEWAHLEHILDLIIWELAEIAPAKGACITSQVMGAANRCKVICLLIKQKNIDQKIIKKISTLQKNTHAVSEERNRIIHDPWYEEFATGKASQFKSMPYSEKTYGFLNMTEDELKRTLEKIRDLCVRAGHLRSAIQNALNSST